MHTYFHCMIHITMYVTFVSWSGWQIVVTTHSSSVNVISVTYFVCLL